MSKLHIITPCSRVFNLPLIYLGLKELRGFDWQWNIIVDRAAKEYFALPRILRGLDDPRIAVVRSNISNSFVGHSLRNIALDALEESEEKEYYIYQLDDDTIMHDNFMQLAPYLSIHEGPSMCYVFDQAYRDEGIRLSPAVEPIFGRCDTGTFCLPSHMARKTRYSETDYAGDFLYIKEIHHKFPTKFIKPLNVPASYYNWITDQDLTFKH